MPSHRCIATLSDGEFFGELSLLDESPRSASAIAYKPCKILCFFQADLFDLINHDPRVGVKITIGLARTIGYRLKQTNECLHSMQNTELEPGSI
ncbi:MAG: cyclic nucleotide-binding domain-containing protein [Nitrospirae bacterium]|nr:cyclic nucleotide-binding domain-containing protein [Nitrospirota bacterium]